MPSRLKEIRRIILNNRELKILSLLLAAISWYAIRGIISNERDLDDVPLEIHAPPGVAIMGQAVTELEITVRGSREDISRLIEQKDDIKAVRELKTTEISGSREMHIKPKHIVGVPRGIRVIRVRPSEVMVELDAEGEKEVPVKAKYEGEPYEAQVEAAICEPKTVTIWGPVRRLEKMPWVFTETIDVEGRGSSFEKRAKIDTPSDSGVSHVKPQEVTVSVTIVRKSTNREWKEMPVTALLPSGSESQVFIKPAVVNVSLMGPASALENIGDDSLRAFVDCSQLAIPGEYDLPVKVHVPTAMGVDAAVEPETVKITLKAP